MSHLLLHASYLFRTPQYPYECRHKTHYGIVSLSNIGFFHLSVARLKTYELYKHYYDR